MSSPPPSGRKTPKTAFIKRLAKPFTAKPNLHFANPSVQEASTSFQADIPQPQAAPVVDDEDKSGDAPNAAAELAHRSLWSRAADELGEESQYLKRVREYLKELYSIDSPADAIAQMLEKQHGKVLAKDGVSQTRWRRFVRHTSKYLSNSQGVVMGLARLDPHGTASLVFGGLFCLVQAIQGGAQESADAVTLTMEVAELIALWTCLEEQQIKHNLNSSLKDLYTKLGDEIVELYKAVIVLLGKLLPYFDSNWRKFFNVLASEKDEWTNCNNTMKGHEANCNRIKKQISITKTEQERASTTLKWISSHDFRGAYKGVQERTLIDTVYKDRAQLVLKDDKFRLWDTPGKSSTLWLRGTIGTGKTTLVARAIHEISSTGEVDSSPLAIFFFDKTRTPDATSVDTCLRSLTRQLSWNHAVSAIESSADRVYSALKDERPADSLTKGECLELLKNLLSQKEAYIVIDAIDECKDPNQLLETLVTLSESVKGHGSLHIMLAGRMRPHVSEYFEGCLTVTTNSATSLTDQEFYIETEIERKRQLRKGSLFFTSKKDFPGRLKTILAQKAQGLFRWIEIQIAVFTGGDFRGESAIEKKLERIDELYLDPGSDDILRKEYESLLKDLGKDEHSHELALKMLRFIACSFWPLSAASLADAINASMRENDFDDLTAEDVGRLLLGFVSEVNTNPIYEDTRYVHGNLAIELAHASVLEYLMNDSNHGGIAGCFTTLAQHSDAAALCLASISHGLSWDIIPDDSLTYRQRVSDLIYYSCLEWPQHCKLAFAEGENLDLGTAVRKFILSGSCMKWNYVLRGLLTSDQKFDGGGYFSRFRRPEMTSYLWSAAGAGNPGFAVALCNMTTLLDDPQIKPMIKIGDLNGRGQNLFHVSLELSKRETVLKLLEVHPEPIPWSGSLDTLLIAIDRHLPLAVQRLMDSCRNSRRHETHYGQNITLALRHALRRLNSETTPHAAKGPVSEESKLLAEIIRLLLVNGANLFAASDRGRGMMHFAKKRFTQELLINHARRLEDKGLRGSVQRLLRIRDITGQTAIDSVSPATQPYLEDQLSQAVQRDGTVMYDFDDFDIPALGNGVTRVDLLKYLLMRNGRNGPDSKAIPLDHAFREYREWLADRTLQLKKQYVSNQIEISRNGFAAASEEELPGEWDETERRVEKSRWLSVMGPFAPANWGFRLETRHGPGRLSRSRTL